MDLPPVRIRDWLDNGGHIFIQARAADSGWGAEVNLILDKNGPRQHKVSTNQKVEVEIKLVSNINFDDSEVCDLFHLTATHGGLGHLEGPAVWTFDPFLAEGDTLLVAVTGRRLTSLGEGKRFRDALVKVPLDIYNDFTHLISLDFERIEELAPGAAKEQRDMQNAPLSGTRSGRPINQGNIGEDTGVELEDVPLPNVNEYDNDSDINSDEPPFQSAAGPSVASVDGPAAPIEEPKGKGKARAETESGGNHGIDDPTIERGEDGGNTEPESEDDDGSDYSGFDDSDSDDDMDYTSRRLARPLKRSKNAARRKRGPPFVAARQQTSEPGGPVRAGTLSPVQSPAPIVPSATASVPEASSTPPAPPSPYSAPPELTYFRLLDPAPPRQSLSPTDLPRSLPESFTSMNRSGSPKAESSTLPFTAAPQQQSDNITFPIRSFAPSQRAFPIRFDHPRPAVPSLPPRPPSPVFRPALPFPSTFEGPGPHPIHPLALRSYNGMEHGTWQGQNMNEVQQPYANAGEFEGLVHAQPYWHNFPQHHHQPWHFQQQHHYQPEPQAANPSFPVEHDPFQPEFSPHHNPIHGQNHNYHYGTPQPGPFPTPYAPPHHMPPMPGPGIPYGPGQGPRPAPAMLPMPNLNPPRPPGRRRQAQGPAFKSEPGVPRSDALDAAAAPATPNQFSSPATANPNRRGHQPQPQPRNRNRNGRPAVDLNAWPYNQNDFAGRAEDALRLLARGRRRHGGLRYRAGLNPKHRWGGPGTGAGTTAAAAADKARGIARVLGGTVVTW